MKIVGRLQILDETQTQLDIDPELASASRLRPQSILDAVVLLPAGRGSDPVTPVDHLGDPASRVTLIASPLPEPSWGNLVRLSATLDPKPGSLRKLLSALNALHLRCRFVETINDVDLLRRSFFGLDLGAYALSESEDRISNLIIPSTMAVIELPKDFRSLKEISQEESEVHALLRRIADEVGGTKKADKRKAESCLQRLLIEQERTLNVEIEWISPMSTLNRLSRRLRSHAGQGSRRFSRRFLVTSSQTGFKLDLLSLRHILWDIGLPMSSPSSSHSRSSIFVKAFMDSDEKILCWDFYQLANDLVVQFDLVTPSAGREHLWWQWIYDCLEKAKGNVLASASSTQVDGGWTTLQATVVFPFQEKASPGAPGDIAIIVNCFRKLQGDRGFTEDFEKLKNLLAREGVDGIQVGPNALSKAAAPVRSLLQNLEVWDPSGRSSSRIRSYSERFPPNPFNFTSPLNLDRYRQLYGENMSTSEKLGESLGSRRRLAMRVLQKLTGERGENIAIVGAHRSGKTTVLNLVYDILMSDAAHGGVTLIPLRINAAMDPPHMFLSAIVRELRNLKDELPDKPKSRQVSMAANEVLNQLSNQLSRVAEMMRRSLAPLVAHMHVGLEQWTGLPLAFALGGLIDLFKAKGQGGDAQKPESEKLSLEQIQELGSGPVMPLLRASLDLLREAVQQRGNQLLIIVDEFSESSQWSHGQALPIWRFVIESEEYSRLRWLISTSRPIKEASDYSPITNVLHEYNVGPLPLKESERLIDAFSVVAWSKEILLATDEGKVKANAESGERVLHPVVMHQARVFLLEITSRLPYFMQVVCYHIYDRATRTYIPLISRSLCIEIVCDYVLSELSDYLEHQWSQIKEEGHKYILDSLELFKNQKEFLRGLDRWKDDVQDLPQGLRKALERSGLRGDDSHSVAPLVACWLLAPSREK